MNIILQENSTDNVLKFKFDKMSISSSNIEANNIKFVFQIWYILSFCDSEMGPSGRYDVLSLICVRSMYRYKEDINKYNNVLINLFKFYLDKINKIKYIVKSKTTVNMYANKKDREFL